MFLLLSSHLQALQELDPRWNELQNALWDPHRLHDTNWLYSSNVLEFHIM